MDRVPALHGQHVGGRRVQSAPEGAREPGTFFGIVEFGIGGRDVGRQCGFFGEQRRFVFIRGRDERGVDLDTLRDAARERSGVGARRIAVCVLRRDAIGIMP